MALITRDLLIASFVVFSSNTKICNGAVDLLGAVIPNFTGPILNKTVTIGREAVLECNVDTLSVYKIAWLRVDTQTILTIHNHVITKNHRIGVTNTEHRNWYLHIRDVRRSDKGRYMCQINTDPMKSQIGYLNVVVPPKILDHPTSSDMVVREGTNVSLQCAASGSPEPSITWRREGGELISTSNNASVFEGFIFNISKVNRLQMGPYLCIASNGVPPSVSKRIMLIIHFPPMIWIQNQLVGAMEGQQITLECHSEAFPKSINYWTRDDGRMISQGTKYEPQFVDNTYKVHMRLTIRNVSVMDYGSYMCIAKNSLGDTDGTIKLYHIPTPSTAKPFYPSTTQSNPIIVKKVKKPTKENAYHNIIHNEENPTSKLEKPIDLFAAPSRNTLNTDSQNLDQTPQISSCATITFFVIPMNFIFIFFLVNILGVNTFYPGLWI